MARRRVAAANASGARRRSTRTHAARIGTAGWNVPRTVAADFGDGRSHLERYATRLNAAEIDTSFYRSHSAATYARWAATVPADFRYAVKLPKAVTHELRLVATGSVLDAFLAEVGGLGDRLGCLLVQLPPSLEYAPRVAAAFLRALRSRFDGAVAIEPRHASWFEDAVDARLHAAQVARVAADPAVVPGAARPGGDPALAYFRLHGSPEMYRTAYGRDRLPPIAASLREALARGADAWCIFDNTMLGAAAADALRLQALLVSPSA